MQGGQIWGLDAGVVDWRTDLDYDGFDWGASVWRHSCTAAQTYPDISGTLAAAPGLEAHGRPGVERHVLRNLRCAELRRPRRFHLK